ncbi:hypothetical protein [Subtercola boreus]|nr:hypothetical protein [Subtercola boreus]
MMIPDIDVEASTEEELIAAYIRDGFTEDQARNYAWLLKNPDPAFPLD